MAFEKMKIYFNNLFRNARLGNDGTSYATCVEAVADPDDAYKVRGDIVPADDIPNLSDLEGSGVVFDTTKNEYRITDSFAGMQNLGTEVFPASERDAPKATVVVGSHLYTLHSGSTIVISKTDLVTLERIGSMSLESTSSLASGMVTDGTFLFISCRDGNTVRVVFVRLSSFLEEDALTLSSTNYLPSGIAHNGNYLYIACRDVGGAGNVARLARVRVSPLEEVDGVTLASTEELPGPVTINPPGTVASITNIDTASSNVLQVTRVSLSSMTRLSTGIATGAQLPKAMRFADDGDYLFVTGKNVSSVGVVCRFNGSTGAYIDTLTLAANEEDPQAITQIGTELWAVTRYSATPVVRIVRITESTFVRLDYLDLDTTETLEYTIAVNGDVTSAYVGVIKTISGDNYSAHVEVATSTFTRTDFVRYNSASEDPAAIISDGTYIYIAVETESNVAKLLRYVRATHEYVGAVELDVALLYPRALEVDETYIYVACRDTGNTGMIGRVSVSSFEYVDALTLDTTDKTPVGLILDGGYLDVLCVDASSVSRIVRCFVASFTKDTAQTYLSGDNNPASFIMSPDSQYIYVLCDASGTLGSVVQITAATLARVTSVSFPAGRFKAKGLGFSQDGTDLYVQAEGSTPFQGYLRKYVAHPLAYTSEVALNSDERTPILSAVLENDIYIVCKNASNEVTLARCTVSPFQRRDAVVLASTELNPAAGLYYDTFFYIVNPVAGSGRLQKIDTLQNFAIFERLQTADIGDSSTVRAGLTCAQSDPLRPVHYIADTNGTPVAKHLDNTAVSIRGHAPNFVEDGGFESGGVTEWTAGANWAIESTDELEGLYSVAWDTAADNNLTQNITKKLKKGKIYRCIFKAATLTGDASAGVLTFQVKQAGSGTDVDTLTGNAPAITTTPTWYGFDIVPDFETNNWELRLVPALAQKGTATAVIVDEIYIYEKPTINSLIVKNHNWSGQGTIVVNAWRVSPFRSTATADANNKTQIASFTVDDSDTLLQALTETNYPIIEITLPAVSGWIAEAGEIYVGDYWEVTRYPQSFDPYRVNASNLREVTIDLQNLQPALRTTTIADIFEKLQAGESVWWKWDIDKPLLVESMRAERNAPYSPYRINTQMRLVEKS